MKIIFLDFDGVLNNRDTIGGMLDPKLVQRLNEFEGAEIVVSSTWRLNNSVQDLTNILRTYGFNGKVFDKTPSVVSGMWRFRGIDIKTWIHDNEKSLGEEYWLFDDYVILDDDDDMLYEQRNNFIHVDNEVGITTGTIRKAKRKLKLPGYKNIF